MVLKCFFHVLDFRQELCAALLGRFICVLLHCKLRLIRILGYWHSLFTVYLAVAVLISKLVYVLFDTTQLSTLDN